MKRNSLRSHIHQSSLCVCGALLLGSFAPLIRADQVQMQNGDRYFGTVVSLDSGTLTLKNEFLGTVRLPRGKVAVVTFGATAPAATTLLSDVQAKANVIAPTNSSAGLASMMRQLGAQSNLLQQVESQFLSGAGPEAKDKFNELLGGLMSGRLNVDNIRAEAQSAAERMRAARKDLGEDAGWMLDSYLAVLDHFVKETAPPPGAATASAKPAPKPRSAGPLAEEE